MKGGGGGFELSILIIVETPLPQEKWEGEGPKCLIKWGVATFFITLQFNYIYCMRVGKVKFPLLRFDSSA